MADEEKTIPELTEAFTLIDTNVLPVDIGTETKRVTVATLRKLFGTGLQSAIKTSAYSLLEADVSSIIRINSAGGVFNLSLPNPNLVTNKFFAIKDVGGVLGTNAVTLVRFSGEQIGGVATNYILRANFGVWYIYSDGTNWVLT